MTLKKMNFRLDMCVFFVKNWFFKDLVNLEFEATSRSRLWECRSKHKKELYVRSHGVI